MLYNFGEKRGFKMIKNFLKQNNITLIQFANDLNISRPTLDIYIRTYDNGGEISNPIFQKIFDFLFEDTTISQEEFLSKYEYVKSYYGKKDSDLNSLHSKSISAVEEEQDEYVLACDEIIDLLEKSKENVRYKMDKIESIKELLNEESTSFDIVWQGKKHAVIKIKNHNNYFLCLVMSKDEPDAFRPEDVFFSNQFKYCVWKSHESSEYLISLGKCFE